MAYKLRVNNHYELAKPEDLKNKLLDTKKASTC